MHRFDVPACRNACLLGRRRVVIEVRNRSAEKVLLENTDPQLVFGLPPLLEIEKR